VLPLPDERAPTTVHPLNSMPEFLNDGPQRARKWRLGGDDVVQEFGHGVQWVDSGWRTFIR
jgi:hypothetical protein